MNETTEVLKEILNELKKINENQIETNKSIQSLYYLLDDLDNLIRDK